MIKKEKVLYGQDCQCCSRPRDLRITVYFLSAYFKRDINFRDIIDDFELT